MKSLRNFKNEDFNSSDNPALSEALKKYGNMGEDELINQLLVSVRSSRANGTYNPSQMDAYVEMLKPHITAQQYEKLKNIVHIINSENV